MSDDPATDAAFALDGLIRSRVNGDGGGAYANKCIRDLAAAIRELATPKEGEDEHARQPDQT